MAHAHSGYLPAFGHDALLPLYDPLVKLLGADRARERLIAQAGVQPGQRVLDIGCGTGTLAIRIKRREPGVEVIGLDPDPKALARSRRKAARARVGVRFDEGYADRLPYADAEFDRVFSSLMLHHLERDAKRAALREAHRVLRPGGSLHLMDFAGPESGERGRLARLLHANARMRGNAQDQVLGLMQDAGFADVGRTGTGELWIGAIVYYAASRGG